MRIENGFHIYEKQITHEDLFGGAVWIRVQVEAKRYYEQGYTTTEIEKEIREQFYRYCNCAHDCCACWNGGIYKLEKIGKFTWKGLVSYYRNV